MVSLAPNILVHEYFSGGGCLDGDLSAGLAVEGLVMLKAVLADFQAWGAAKITTTLDRRLSEVSLPAQRLAHIDPEEYHAVLEQLAGRCTAALIIAPESDGILARLSGLMESRGARLLCSSPASVATAGDKWDCHRRFIRAGLPAPETRLTDLKSAMGTAAKIGFPLVIKPVDGVGCEGVNFIPDAAALQTALERNPFYGNRFLLQRYIEGDHASVSLLVTAHAISCLSLNRQCVEIGTPFRYQGGEVFFDSDKREEALCLAKRAVSLVPGLKGYVGVDLLINHERCYLIEINPRLTTSYIGLRRVVNINLAQAIYKAVIHGVLPQDVSLSGSFTFTL